MLDCQFRRQVSANCSFELGASVSAELGLLPASALSLLGSVGVVSNVRGPRGSMTASSSKDQMTAMAIATVTISRKRTTVALILGLRCIRTGGVCSGATSRMPGRCGCRSTETGDSDTFEPNPGSGFAGLIGRVELWPGAGSTLTPSRVSPVDSAASWGTCTGLAGLPGGGGSRAARSVGERLRSRLVQSLTCVVNSSSCVVNSSSNCGRRPLAVSARRRSSIMVAASGKR
jgi:hypothetical protein